MDSDQLMDKIRLLPILIQEKIVYYYVVEYLKFRRNKKALQTFNSITGYKEYKLKCLYFDKYNQSGYININEIDLKYIQSKFPFVHFNSNISNNYFRSLVQNVWSQVKFYYKQLKILPSKPENHNIYIAGGFFTNYNGDLKISEEFRDYYRQFCNNQDIDVYYTNQQSASNQNYDSYYLKINEFYYLFNLVHFKQDNFPLYIADSFDFDCCNFFFVLLLNY